MLKRITLPLLGLMMLLTCLSSTASTLRAENEEPVRAELVVENETIQPGQPFWVGIRLQLDHPWHAYWKNPGDSGMAPVINWNLPEGFEVTPLQWPTPENLSTESAVTFGYQEEVVFLAQVTPPKNAGTTAELGAEVMWVACDEASCLPGNAKVTVILPIDTATPKAKVDNLPLFKNALAKLPRSDAQIVAERKDGLVTLHLETTEEIAEALFFPEDSSRIDHSINAVLTKPSDDSGKHHIILKETEGADADAPLKGVLTLRDSKNALTSYEVDIAVPQEGFGDVALNLTDDPVAMETPIATDHEFNGGLGLGLLFAFLGGLILNLMPCVLPVISFKVLSFIKMANQSRSLIFKHGVAFSAGVIISFWVLAGILLGAQAYGRAAGWGFQLQEPLFVAILAAIIFIFGLSMFGVFEIGTGLAAMAGQAQTSSSSQGGLVGSFFSGVLATAIATPCTGPFLGTAVGFAVGLPAPLAMLVFTTLGLGMATPYLLLGAFPGLLRFMPKPGNWMITFKEILGFVMLATVLWLVWVFGAQTNTFSVFLLLTGFFILGIGCWIFGKWATPVQKKMVRRVSLASVLFCFLLGGYVLFQATNASILFDNYQTSPGEIAAKDSDWETFSSKRLQELHKKRVPVFVDFTAKWCLVCQANHLVLSTDSVSKKFKELGVVKMKADWTRSSEDITKELRKFGRNSVPLYLLYLPEPNTPPTILPQILTPDIVLGHLDGMNKDAKVVASRK